MAGSFYARHAFMRSMGAMKIISRGSFHFASRIAREISKVEVNAFLSFLSRGEGRQ